MKLILKMVIDITCHDLNKYPIQKQKSLFYYSKFLINFDQNENALLTFQNNTQKILCVLKALQTRSHH
ncbi:hypothetical protein DERP_007573 [Dermatophagoides pteronyssinus]|uniref:Uncharacterized protein n=1 Tax=Dermatophagoides pteronyssinus TaxID=6956 RepID=A0ABQ8JKK7_DERPT|nr:hypothetical protein DERP_007573 [Dermatophagoides pteronyssinus]